MLKYGALIDGLAPLTVGPGFRFNAVMWQTQTGHEEDECTRLEMFVKGLRVKNGLIHLPAMNGRQTSYPVVFLPKPFAEAVVAEVLSSQELRQRFPDAFPLMRESALVEGLLFPERDMIRDYPGLAKARGWTVD